MSLDAAFGENVTPGEFFTEHLPDLFEPWTDLYGDSSEVDLIIGMRITGEGEGEWTLIFSDVDLEAEDGRDAAPLVCIEGMGEFWKPMHQELRRWLELAHRARDSGELTAPPAEYRFTNKRLSDLEEISGHINLTFRDSPAGTVSAKIFFNSFDDPGPSGLDVSMDYEDFLRALRGEISFKTLGMEKKVDVSGDMKLPMKLMSAVL